MTPLYAIGDIHGQAAMLDQALDLIHADGGPDAQIVFLGDYTDRGPDSRAVIKTLIAGRNAGRNWTFLKGNHDRFFSRFVREGRQHDPRVKSGLNWLNPRLGGIATLASYGVEVVPEFTFAEDAGLELVAQARLAGETAGPDDIRRAAEAAIPDAHLDFLESLPLMHQTAHHIFVHAGVNPSLPLDAQDPEDLLWIREGFLEDDTDHGRLIVHGHTALDRPQHHGNRVNLDGGAGYGRPLVPAVFEGRDCWLLTDVGRVPLRP